MRTTKVRHLAIPLVLAAITPVTVTDSSSALAAETIKVTAKNYAAAETARNFRNWMKLGANDKLVHLKDFPPRSKKAPTVQMNDDTIYSIAVVETVNGKVEFSIPKVDVYLAVQVVNQGGHGQHYVVEAGDFDLPVDTRFAMLIYRTGTEKGLETTLKAQAEIPSDMLKFGTYKLPNYDWKEVEEWTTRLTAETQGKAFAYTFPRTAKDITDLHQWNLENANGWGGASPEVNVANKYVNSAPFKANKCLKTTFTNPKSRFFTSFTAYDSERYLIDGVKNINSHKWKTNDDGTISVSFNCGSDGINNIDTRGKDFSFTIRYYGVSQTVLDGKIAPEKTVN